MDLAEKARSGGAKIKQGVINPEEPEECVAWELPPSPKTNDALEVARGL